MSSMNNEEVSRTLAEISQLENEFIEVELASLRQKEFNLKSLYAKRENLLNKIPGFWPTAFEHTPGLVEQFVSPADVPVFASLKNVSVERYQIISPTEGEPRSLRFIFEFSKNDYFEDEKLVKDFEYVTSGHGGAFVSKPVPIKWKNKKKDLTQGLLDAATEVHAAEQSMKLKSGDQVIDGVEREGLWQYEKLRSKLQSLEESNEDRSIFCWFGYRGAVLQQEARQEDDDEDEGPENKDDRLLDVEIFPDGEELAITIADDLWPSALECFMGARGEDADDDEDEGLDNEDADEEGEEDVPDLVAAGEGRPSKKPRKS